MSAVAIRAALETALSGMAALSTAYENAPFTPVAGTAYQRVTVLFAEPDNSETASNYVERGFMQVSLCYPLGTGSAAVAARAELLRATFRRGLSFTSGSVSVWIIGTPEITPGFVDGDRYIVPVRIRFYASVEV